MHLLHPPFEVIYLFTLIVDEFAFVARRNFINGERREEGGYEFLLKKESLLSYGTKTHLLRG